jgi:FkbM family methyltransferase
MVSLPTSRAVARTVLRPLPGPILTRAATLPRVGRYLRAGLSGRAVVVPSGAARGLRMNPGRSNPAYALGSNERAVQEAFERLVSPGSVAYDVGANVGFFTVVLARLVGPHGYVYAFEPSAENAAVVRENVARNGFHHVLVVCRAVGSSTGPQLLQVSSYSGGHALQGAEAPPDQVGTLPVEVVSLDDFAAQPGVRPPEIVKIDVEGFELGVLHGMRTTLERHRPTLLVEVDDATTAGHDRKVAEITGFLEEAGYSLERLADSYPPGGWVVSHWVAQA